MPKISLIQASVLYKVTVRTIHNWIAEDNIKSENHLYSLDDLQDAYDKRRKPKPRFRLR
jgi:D-arabinose 1-dehydrogenase-like Zn-dependent alcohol dehydrogenase